MERDYALTKEQLEHAIEHLEQDLNIAIRGLSLKDSW